MESGTGAWGEAICLRSNAAVRLVRLGTLSRVSGCAGWTAICNYFSLEAFSLWGSAKQNKIETFSYYIFFFF